MARVVEQELRTLAGLGVRDELAAEGAQRGLHVTRGGFRQELDVLAGRAPQLSQQVGHTRRIVLRKG
ncbi:MAG: hypothetical protein RLZZ450_2308 [Pseudomonadota bacterium]